MYIIENKIIVIVALDGEIMENFISPFCFSVSFKYFLFILMNYTFFLEEEMATHSSILAWRIPVEREAWRATVYGVTNSQTLLSN